MEPVWRSPVSLEETLANPLVQRMLAQIGKVYTDPPSQSPPLFACVPGCSYGCTITCYKSACEGGCSSGCTAAPTCVDGCSESCKSGTP